MLNHENAKEVKRQKPHYKKLAVYFGIKNKTKYYNKRTIRKIKLLN